MRTPRHLNLFAAVIIEDVRPRQQGRHVEEATPLLFKPRSGRTTSRQYCRLRAAVPSAVIAREVLCPTSQHTGGIDRVDKDRCVPLCGFNHWQS
jgi:hypothetical protein